MGAASGLHYKNSSHASSRNAKEGMQSVTVTRIQGLNNSQQNSNGYNSSKDAAGKFNPFKSSGNVANYAQSSENS